MILAALFFAAATARPSFDCAKAASTAEKLVCEDRNLAAIDRELGLTYRAALKMALPQGRKNLIAEQRGWVKGRDDCWKGSTVRQCVTFSYLDRIYDLRNRFGEPREDRDDSGLIEGPISLYCDGRVWVQVMFLNTVPKTAFLNQERSNWRKAWHLTAVSRGKNSQQYQAADGSAEVWVEEGQTSILLANDVRRACKRA